METPLHADHQLDQLAAQFEDWRPNRTQPRQRIPDALWDQAVALCTDLPYTRVATSLRLGNKELKARLQAQPAATPAALVKPPSLIAVPPGADHLLALTDTQIEIERPDGARLRLHASDTSLATIVQSFLEASSCCNFHHKRASF